MVRARTSMDVGRGPMATACACSGSDGFARSRVATRAPSIRGTRKTPSTCASGSWTLMEDCGPGRREGQVRRERLHPEYPGPAGDGKRGPVRAGRAPLDVLHGEPVLLVGEARQSCRVRTLRVGHLPPLLYPVVAVPVVQNREKPRLRGSAGPLAGSMLPGLEQRVLHEVVALGGVAVQRQRRPAQMRHPRDKFGREAVARRRLGRVQRLQGAPERGRQRESLIGQRDV